MTTPLVERLAVEACLGSIAHAWPDLTCTQCSRIADALRAALREAATVTRETRCSPFCGTGLHVDYCGKTIAVAIEALAGG